MLAPLLSSPPALYIHAIAFFAIAFTLIQLGHRTLDLLRDYRDFRDGY